MIYNRETAVLYGLTYALTPNPAYIYIADNDCTNFISQCLRAGGALNDYGGSHPWWYAGGGYSVSWSVAESLYWYIRVNSTESGFGIKADTYYLDNYDAYGEQIAGKVELGDIIQYRNTRWRIQHTAIITDFDEYTGEPLLSQHTFNGRNVTWRKPIFVQAIFHHITNINQ